MNTPKIPEIVPSLLSHSTFKEADYFYESYIAGQVTTAMVTIGDLQFLVDYEKAVKILELFIEAAPGAAAYTTYTGKSFTLPTLRVLSAHEKRCHWLATYFNVSLADISEYCKPDPIRVMMRRFKLEFTPPDPMFPAIDDDLGD